MQSYPEPVLATAAALDEIAAIWLAEAAAFFDRFGADVLADALLVQVREHRTRALQLWALDGARRQMSTRRRNRGP